MDDATRCPSRVAEPHRVPPSFCGRCVTLLSIVFSRAIVQDLAGTLERARAKVKPQRKDGSAAGSPGGGGNDDDDATAHELGLNAEVCAAWHRLGVKAYRRDT